MVQIGSNSSSLRDALSVHYDGHIRTSDGFFIMTDLNSEKFPDDLSAFLLERMLPRMLLNAIAESEATTPDEQEYLADTVSSEIIENGTAEHFRKILAQAIRNLLAEGSCINIEGLLFFRLRTELSDFYNTVAECVAMHHEAQEKNRLLRMLRDHIRKNDPRSDYLRIVRDSSDYQLYDQFGRTIRCVFSEEYTPEEHLLNSLLYLSPAMLDLSALDQPELKNILAEIFADRIISKK